MIDQSDLKIIKRIIHFLIYHLSFLAPNRIPFNPTLFQYWVFISLNILILQLVQSVIDTTFKELDSQQINKTITTEQHSQLFHGLYQAWATFFERRAT